MSSQEKGIPLHNVPDNAGYRLIELPPELQSLLESEAPPVLTLESSDTAALLRTPNKIYALRQKNTSNGLILLKPHTPDSSTPELGLAAFSTIHETVELQAVSEASLGGPDGKPASAKGKWHERFGRNR
ncbi:hypothetical protein ACO1O0_003122 [Amphichorda felina]